MTYNEEQRAIIRRIGEISRRFDTAAQANQTAQAQASQRLLDLGAALLETIDRSGNLVKLNQEHGDALREFLDTL